MSLARAEIIDILSRRLKALQSKFAAERNGRIKGHYQNAILETFRTLNDTRNSGAE